MKGDLVMFVPAEAHRDRRWFHVTAEGLVLARGVGADAGDCRYERLILVLPGWAVAARRLQSGNAGKAQMEAVFAIEETIAGNIDDMHMVLADDGQKAVAWLTDPARLASWVGAPALGRGPDAALPDYLCLPEVRASVSTGRLGKALLMRRGAWGMSVDTGLGLDASAIARACKQENAPHVDVLAEAGGDDERLAIMAVAAARSRYSLLQGRFVPRWKWQRARRTWVVSGLLAAACAVATAALIWSESAVLNAKARSLRAETEQAVRMAVPDSSLGPRAYLRRIAEADAHGDFLSLSAILADAVTSVPALGVESIVFQGNIGEMRADIRFHSYRDLSALGRALAEHGAEVREGPSRQDGDSRQGTIWITIP